MIFNKIETGKTVQNKTIEAFKYETEVNRPYLYLMAGVHGDEIEGVFVLKMLFDWLKQHQELPYNIVVIPELNRDGLSQKSRVNANGVDLNRNYPSKAWSADFSDPKYNPGPSPLSEPENQYLELLLNKYAPDLIISFHSYKPMINFNGDSKKAAEYISQFNNYEVVGDFEYPTPGSFGEWVPEVYNAGVLTYECPLLSMRNSVEDIWEENKTGLINFLTKSYNK